MQAKPGVVDVLNGVLTMELTAVNRYFLQAEMCRNWGYERLHDKLRSLSIGEMEDAQTLIRHILYLEGLPNVQRLNQVAVGQTILEDLELDLNEEREIVRVITDGISHCASVADFTTRGMLEELVKDEETHVDWFEIQLETVRQVGIENYLTDQIHS